MTYVTNFTSIQLSALEPIITEIEKGTPNFIIEDDPQSIQYMRYLVYSWLNHKGIKSLYKVAFDGSDRLLVQRKQITKPRIVLTEPQSPGIAFALTHLEVEDETAFEDLIMKAVEAIPQQLTKTEAIEALDEWRRLMSKTPKP